MIEKLTMEQLKAMNPCITGYAFWLDKCKGKPTVEQLDILYSHNLGWYLWLAIKLMKSNEDRIRLALFSLEVLVSAVDDDFAFMLSSEYCINLAKRYLGGSLSRSESYGVFNTVCDAACLLINHLPTSDHHGSNGNKIKKYAMELLTN